MSFSIVLFGTPIGYKYEKIDFITGNSVVEEDIANKFDRFEVNKLGLGVSEKIWVFFKETNPNGDHILGIGLYQSAYEFNQDRSGGYYGVGLLLNNSSLNELASIKSTIENIFNLTARFILEDNKHKQEDYRQLRSRLLENEKFRKSIDYIKSLQKDLEVQKDSASLNLSYIYVKSEEVSPVFNFLINNQCHFQGLVCFCIDSLETENTICSLGSKNIFLEKDLLFKLDNGIKKNSIENKEKRLRKNCSIFVDSKKKIAFSIKDMEKEIEDNILQNEQLSLKVKFLEEKNDKLKISVEEKEKELIIIESKIDKLKVDIEVFEKETGREILRKSVPDRTKNIGDILVEGDGFQKPIEIPVFNNELSNRGMSSRGVTNSPIRVNPSMNVRPNISTSKSRIQINRRNMRIKVKEYSFYIFIILFVILLVVVFLHFLPKSLNGIF